MAVYSTEIQWGGPEAPWRSDEPLKLIIGNRNQVVPENGAPAAGTTVSWSSTNGNANITFYEDGHFEGSAQFPGEGPVGYRGKLDS